MTTEEQDCSQCAQILSRAGKRAGLEVVRVTHLEAHPADAWPRLPRTFVYVDEGLRIVRFEADVDELADDVTGGDSGLNLSPLQRPN